MDFLAAMPIWNLVIFLVFVIIIVVILVHFLKGKKLKVGKLEISKKEKTELEATVRISEREILKRQIHIARAVCLNFSNSVPYYNNYNEKAIENICFKVSDEIEDLILFNHLSTDDEYVESRFQLIWAVITKNLTNDFGDENKEKLKISVYDNFKNLVKLLLAVRQEKE